MAQVLLFAGNVHEMDCRIKPKTATNRGLLLSPWNIRASKK